MEELSNQPIGQELESPTYTNETHKSTGIDKLRSRLAVTVGCGAAAAAVVIPSFLNKEAQASNEEEPGFTHHEIYGECYDNEHPQLITEFSVTHDAQMQLHHVQSDGETNPIHVTYSQGGHLGDTSGHWDDAFPERREEETLFWRAEFDDSDEVAEADPVTVEYPCDDENFDDSNEDDETDDNQNDQDNNDVGGSVNPADLERVSGATRIETTIEVSQKEYDQAEEVVLAQAGDYPDALTGGPLAAGVEGPLLMTGSGELHESVASELERLGTNHVYILGGEDAISEHVANQLGAHGIAITRLGGEDRFETATIIAREVESLTPMAVSDEPETTTATDDSETTTATSDSETTTAEAPTEETDTAGTNEVLLARAGDFADALAGSSLGSQENSPILLTTGNALHETASEYLEDEGDNIDRITVLGGTAAISSATASQAGLAADTETTERLSGTTRKETAVEIAEEKLRRVGSNVVDATIATAYNWPDALAGGPATSEAGEALILVNGQDHEANGFYEDLVRRQRPNNEEEDQWETVTILGGTEAITPEVATDLITKTNAYPTSYDDSSSTADINDTTFATAATSSDDVATKPSRSEEVARTNEINKNSKMVFRRNPDGSLQEPTIENVA